MWVGGENIVIKGTRLTELIIAYIVDIGERYRCVLCDFISYDVVNTFTHVGYLHLGSQCERCGTVCFQSCHGIEEADAPTSSESPPIVLSSFYNFLGNFSPVTAVEQDIDYIVKLQSGEWRACGCVLFVGPPTATLG